MTTRSTTRAVTRSTTRSGTGFGSSGDIGGQILATSYYPFVGDSIDLAYIGPSGTYQWIDENGDAIGGETTTEITVAITEVGQILPRMLLDGETIYAAPRITILEISYVTNAGVAYSELITLTDPRNEAFLPYCNQLMYKRISNQPTRPIAHWISPVSGDDANDGTLASPWQSSERLNDILCHLTGNRINANEHTVADSTGFKVNGKSWWLGGFVRNTDGNFGPLFEIPGQLSVFIGSFSGAGSLRYKPLVRTWTSLSSTDSWGTTDVGSAVDVWDHIQVAFNDTTKVLKIRVNDQHEDTFTLPGSLDLSLSDLTVGTGTDGHAFSGDFARLFFVRDVEPTSGQMSEIFNSGKGHRDYTLPAALKAVFTTNDGSYWNLNGVNGTTTYTDAISSQTLTRVTGQPPVVINGPDHDPEVEIVDGEVVGGFGKAIAIKSGEVVVLPPNKALATTRQNYELVSYGGSDQAVITSRSIDVPLSSWTVVSGTRYKCACDPVGWLYRATEQAIDDVPLFKVEDAADCGTTSNSFFYDIGAEELHVNIGSDPNGIQFEATPRYTRDNYTRTSNTIYDVRFMKISNVFFQDAGNHEPGTGAVDVDGNPLDTAGYGIQVILDAEGANPSYTPELWLDNVTATGGYHCIGVRSDGGAVLLTGCTMYNVIARNQTGTFGNASGTLFVCFGTGAEVLLFNTTYGGFLPSWDIDIGVTAFSGSIIHGGTSEDLPSLVIDMNSTYVDTPYACRGAANVNGPTSSSLNRDTRWAALRVFIIGTTSTGTEYPEGFGTVQSDGGCGINITPKLATYGSGYLLGSAKTYSINCTYQTDLESNAGDFSVFGNVTVGSIAQTCGCRFNFVNSAGTINMFSASGFTASIQNCIFSETGSGNLVLGTHATATDFVNNAWFGAASGLGTNGVLLGSSPSLTVAPATSSDLYAAGVSQGVTLYDKNNRQRQAIPTIGPIEAA